MLRPRGRSASDGPRRVPRRPHRRCGPDAPSLPSVVDGQTHRFHISVHRVCTDGGPALLRPAPVTPGCSLSLVTASRNLEAGYGEGARPTGRPARRSPDARRGATATLTAESTGGQRSGRSLRRVGADRDRRAVPLRAAGGCRLADRCPQPGASPTPGSPRCSRGRRRGGGFLGYAGPSLWTEAALRSRSSPIGPRSGARAQEPASGGHRVGLRAGPAGPRARPPAGGRATADVVS
jgi:hypothetical protein